MSRVGRRQQQHFSSKEPYLEVPGGSFPEPTLASPNLDSTIDTWAPSSPATAGCLYTAVEARIQLRDKIIPSYPSLKHAYARANVYGEDSIRKGAFLLILRAWGVEMEAGEYDKLWDGLPKNDIGRLGGKEFKELARQPIQNITLPAVVESDVSDVTHMVVQRALDRFGSLDKALASFVPDDSGDISMTQLKMFLKTCGCTLSPNEVKELTAALDKHGTGAVNLTALTAKLRAVSLGSAQQLGTIEGGSPTRATAGASTAGQHTASDGSLGTGVYDEGEEGTEEDEDDVHDVSDLKLSGGVERAAEDVVVSPSSQTYARPPLAPLLIDRPVTASNTGLATGRATKRAGAKYRSRPPPTFVSQADFKRVLTTLGLPLNGSTEEHLSLWYGFVRRFDTNDDGKVNLSEFWAVAAETVSPGVCSRMSLPFLTQPNAGHPKARWHTIIEPPLATALTTAFQRFHTAFRAFDKSNAGYVPRGSILSMCAAAKLELGSGLQEFLDVESGEVVMVSFEDSKSLLVSFMLQPYPPLLSPAKGTLSPSTPGCMIAPDVSLKLMPNWNSFRRVLRAYDADGEGVVSVEVIAGVLSSFGVQLSSVSGAIEASSVPDASPRPSVGHRVSYPKFCDLVIENYNKSFDRGRSPSPAPAALSASRPQSRAQGRVNSVKASPRSPSAVEVTVSGIVIPAEISKLYEAVFGSRRPTAGFKRTKLLPMDLMALSGPAQDTDSSSHSSAPRTTAASTSISSGPTLPRVPSSGEATNSVGKRSSETLGTAKRSPAPAKPPSSKPPQSTGKPVTHRKVVPPPGKKS